MNYKYKVTIMVTISLLILMVSSFFLYRRFMMDKKSSYFDSIYAFQKNDNFYVSVGVNNDNDNRINKAKVTKYNSKMEKIWEKIYNQGVNGEFSNVAIDGEDIIAVGYYEKDKKSAKKNLTTALFVKYDKDGNVLYQRNVQLLGSSKYNKIMVVDDGYIVAGQSIYEDKNLKSPQGGAVLVKYDKEGSVVWKTNYGNSKDASYNDFVFMNNILYVVGKDDFNQAIISKYTLDGDRVDTCYYDGNVNNGFIGITNTNSYFYVTGTNSDNNGVIIKFDLDMDLIDSTIYDSDGDISFNNIITDDKNNLIVIGNIKKSISNDDYSYNGVIAKYKYNLEKLDSLEYSELDNDYFTDIKEVDGNYLVSGYSSYGNDGYLSKFLTYSDALKVLEVK